MGLTLKLNVFLYAFAYHVAKTAVTGAVDGAKAAGTVLDPEIEAMLPYATVAAGVLLGFIQDFLGLGVGLFLTNAASFAVYLSAFLLLDAPKLAMYVMLLKGGQTLQHTMQIGQTVACASVLGGREKAVQLAMLSVFYSGGVIAAGICPPEITKDPRVVLPVATVASALAAILSVSAFQPDDKASGVKLPKAAGGGGFFSLLFSPMLWVFVFAVRYGRSTLSHIATDFPVKAAVDALWPAGAPPLPASLNVDYAIGLPVNLVWVPLLLLTHGRVGSAVRSLCLLGAGLAVAATMPGLKIPVGKAELGLAFVAVATPLYTMPTAMVAAAAPHGTVGRALGLAGAIGASTYTLGGKPFVAAVAPIVRPHLAGTPVTAAAAITAALLLLAFASSVFVKAQPAAVASSKKESQKAAAASSPAGKAAKAASPASGKKKH